MKPYVLSFNEIDKSNLMMVGGKGLNLGELTKIDSILVPDGFCITTEAYRKSIENNVELDELFQALTKLKYNEIELISKVSKKIRSVIENLTMSKNIEDEIIRALSIYGENQSYAVRSSATAEDLPHASFAGQQDTYLNIRGKEDILRHVVKCWASLFTDRAVTYRIKNGFRHEQVLLCVVIQKMIMSEVSGIMFTADPMTSDRMTLSIDAGFGLGEALVSGLITPDIYKVKNGLIVNKNIGSKKIEIVPTKNGGTQELKIDMTRQMETVLSNEQILLLANMGKKIEAYFGAPQDIEWCLANGNFYIVQSRSITTLFPIPKSTESNKPRVFMSIGHTQVMTNPIKPLGISFFGMISESTMDEAGGRIYADITHDLSSFIGKNRIVMATGKQDPLIQSAIKSIVNDKEFMNSLPKGKRNVKGGIFTLSSISETFKVNKKNDPSIIDEMLAGFEKEILELDNQLSKLSGEKAMEFIKNDRDKLLAMSYNPTMLGAIIAAILINDSINKNVEKWLGEKNVADSLIKSLDHNITTEMGLSLCELADTIRNYPEILHYISNNPSEGTFIGDIEKLVGGKVVTQKFNEFFDKYGMRCPGEIDITTDRFIEKPSQLIPILLNNIQVLELGEHNIRFHNGRKEAKIKEDDIINRLKKLNGGNSKAKKIEKSISLLRNFIGCREYPKYYIMKRYQIYKKALIKEADMLVNKGIIKNVEDIFYLYFDELCDVVKTNVVDYKIIEERKVDYIHYERLTPPRIITSDGFVPPSSYSSGNIPVGAFSGIPVSTGVVEGRARVILSVENANIEEGDILVTRFTDPSWTPLFVTIKGLVTEVGGFTTHSAVITREYSLPGIVGVENATKLIKDGQMIRVNGNEGFVEILD